MLWAACQLMHSCGLVVCVIQATANPNEIDNDIFYAPRPPVAATSTGGFWKYSASNFSISTCLSAGLISFQTSG